MVVGVDDEVVSVRHINAPMKILAVVVSSPHQSSVCCV